ncbi:hypothetical protein Y032_0409g936 [Ancylostoma ceylanicum]|uniref:Uncharacterized protein n=1 Tax=Ancylostoma ceylanicum TaxID=53326 RepID=A0A016X2M3_9BILA|nr:hypothetical protein Y032_0409g936 [Ancylostoma ceylanicum]
MLGVTSPTPRRCCDAPIRESSNRDSCSLYNHKYSPCRKDRCVRFLIVAAAESRRDLLDPLTCFMLSPHPSFWSRRDGAAPQSVFLRRTIGAAAQ